MKLYIDPGTGSMLFTILIGILGVCHYFFRSWWVKLRFVLSGGRGKNEADEKIPLIVHSEGRQYWPFLGPICRELAARHFPVTYMTEDDGDPGLSCGYDRFNGVVLPKGNKAFAKLNFVHAVIFFSTTPGLNVFQWKRSRDVDYYVHIPHAPKGITMYRVCLPWIFMMLFLFPARSRYRRPGNWSGCAT